MLGDKIHLNMWIYDWDFNNFKLCKYYIYAIGLLKTIKKKDIYSEMIDTLTLSHVCVYTYEYDAKFTVNVDVWYYIWFINYLLLQIFF